MSSSGGHSGWTRRSLLRAGLVGGGLSAFAGLSVALQPTKRLTQRKGGSVPVLNADQFAVLTAVADRICPSQGPEAPGAVALGIPEEIAAMMAVSPPRVQDGMTMALGFIENPLVGLLTGERIRPFTRLSPEAQDDVLRSYRHSSMAAKRTIYSALRSVVTALYYGHPKLWLHTGYGGPPNVGALRAANRDLLVDYESLRGIG